METVKDKLPEEFKSKWVAALRSGEYKQCKQTIHDKESNSFCCIGVAAVLHGHNPEAHDFSTVGYIQLPDAIANGFRNQNTIDLMHLNDSGKSFTEIADYIEANL